MQIFMLVPIFRIKIVFVSEKVLNDGNGAISKMLCQSESPKWDQVETIRVKRLFILYETFLVQKDVV